MFLSNESKASKEFEPHPKGAARGVCVEVITHNKKTGEPWSKSGDHGTKYQLILAFKTEKQVEVEEGVKEYCVHWEWFNIPESIANENSKLHKFFRDWEVPIKAFKTKEEFEEEVVGRPALCVFTHNNVEGKVYSNLTSCTAIGEDDLENAWVAKDYKPYTESAPF